MGALSDIRVLDLGKYIAGPYCATLLSDFGADVIRVERPGGGEDRYVSPVSSQGEGALFFQVGRNKRSLTLDYTVAEGRAVLNSFIAEADVVITNMPRPALEAMKLDYESLREVKADIITVNVSAFGDRGPWAERPGFDTVGQAMSGSIHLTGTPDQPYRAQVNWVDYSTALHAALGVMIALHARRATGEGQEISASLLETAISYQNPILIDQLALNSNRGGLGNRGYNTGPTDVFRVKDGWIVCHVVGNGIFRRWARLMGDEKRWTEDPRFASDLLRGQNSAHLSETMQVWCSARTRDQALDDLAAAKVPAAPVLSPSEVLTHPQIQALEALRAVGQTGDGVAVSASIAPVSLSASPPEIKTFAPSPGAHTEELLLRAGYSHADIERLRANNLI